MGSDDDYDYRCKFSLVNESEINSQYKSNLKAKAFLFDFRTNFIIRKTNPEGEETIDSERFDARLYEDENADDLYWITAYRLHDYWMTYSDVHSLLNAAIAFAKDAAAKAPHLSLIPVVARLDVCTVQKQGESYDSCLKRAIVARNLVPLYLWPYATVERRPIGPKLSRFLASLSRSGVYDVDKVFTLTVCSLCLEKPGVGSQVSWLRCGHAFHSPCVVRWLEDINLCPNCGVEAYDSPLETKTEV